MLTLLKKYWLVLLILALLVVALPGGVYLATNQTSFFGTASPEETPKEVKITNISDNSFSVSWVTPDKQNLGFLAYGETERLGNSASDDRDTSGTQERYTHHVSLKNLLPSTNYFFKIGSGSKEYDNDSSSYQITTAPTTTDPPPLADPAYGKILTPQGAPATDVLVYLTVDRGTPLSSYTRNDGNWLITLNNARRADLSTYISYKETGDNISLLVNGSNLGRATANADTNNDNPVPDITLGQSYEFGTLGSAPQTTTAPVAESAPSSFSLEPVANVQEASPSALEIQTPAAETAISDSTPTFTGTGKPGEILDIIIESNPIRAKVTVGADGTWAYTPTQNLESGEHKVTIAQAGQTKTQNFSVLGASTAKPSTASAIPVSGTFENTLVIFGFGLLFTLLGSFLIFYK
ncbi:MAG: hypothetical protein G01um10145_772 [Microgenomates group bacterium Gr01-1014_5]|nr:MAG: hypothetical protein G01um10145_772 [Microgenomates group bacterium Gr01-1014_5]